MINQSCGSCSNTDREGLDSGQIRNGFFRCTVTGNTVHETEGSSCSVWDSDRSCGECRAFIRTSDSGGYCRKTGLEATSDDGQQCGIFVEDGPASVDYAENDRRSQRADGDD